jgi:hypothetical protein
MPRLIAYVWSLPTTLLGLPFLALSVVSGGRTRIVDGVIETHGRAVAWFLRRGVPLVGGARAMTLGHIVLGRDAESLDATRDHERIHVAQCERWGPLFVPAYLVASLTAAVRGRDPYRANGFEVAAYRDATPGANTGLADAGPMAGPDGAQTSSTPGSSRPA